MSLAVLKRKTKATAPRFSTNKCFVLNMTGRGNAIGRSGKYGQSVCGPLLNQKLTFESGFCTSGLKSTTCANVEYMAPDCSSCPAKWRLHKPAPQMGYGVYINRKAKGGFRPSGYPCNNPTKCATTSKPVWKLTKTYDSSLVIEKKRIQALRCGKFSTPRDPSSGKITSTVKPCQAGLKQNKWDNAPQNKRWCNNVTKDLGGRRSASEQTARSKGAAITNMCGPPCPESQTLYFEIADNSIQITNQKSSCRNLITRGYPYKVFVKVVGTPTLKIYTNMSSNPTKMCDVFFNKQLPSVGTFAQIANITVSNSFCANMNPLLYFEVGTTKVALNISKSYKGYGLVPPRAGPKQCH
jgi:hypothetical protein